jgi:hypothetical protein
MQVSSLQELPVEAKVSDDLSVTKSGAVFSINGNSKEDPVQASRHRTAEEAGRARRAHA